MSKTQAAIVIIGAIIIGLSIVPQFNWDSAKAWYLFGFLTFYLVLLYPYHWVLEKLNEHTNLNSNDDISKSRELKNSIRHSTTESNELLDKLESLSHDKNVKEPEVKDLLKKIRQSNYEADDKIRKLLKPDISLKDKFIRDIQLRSNRFAAAILVYGIGAAVILVLVISLN